jgi:hypothetical protein
MSAGPAARRPKTGSSTSVTNSAAVDHTIRKLRNHGKHAGHEKLRGARISCAHASSLRRFGLLNQQVNKRTPLTASITQCI